MPPHSGNQDHCAAGMPGRKQPDRRGNPHGPRAHHRKKRQETPSARPRTQPNPGPRSQTLRRRSIPWTAAITRLVVTLAKISSRASASIRSRMVSSNGRENRKRSRIDIAIAKEIKQRKEHDEQFEKEYDDVSKDARPAAKPCIRRAGWRPGARVPANQRSRPPPRARQSIPTRG